MTTCECMRVMQRQSTTPIDVRAKRDSLWPADEPDVPCPRDCGGRFAPGGRTQQGVARALLADVADGESEGDAPPLPQPPVLQTVAATSSIVSVELGAHSRLLHGSRQVPSLTEKIQKLIDDAEATPHFDVNSATSSNSGTSTTSALMMMMCRATGRNSCAS